MPALSPRSYIPVPASERVQRTTTKTVHGDCVSLSTTESRLRSCIDSKVVNRLDDDRNAGQSGAGTMRQMVCVRGLLLVAGIAASGALWPSASRAFTQEDQRRLCTPDVLRLCSSEIPDVERITACMRRQRANLSEGCRSVFGKPAQSASADR
jgi:hypothetical protein